MKLHRHRSALLAVATVLLLAACAQLRTEESALEGTGGEVYYASTALLTVHAQPSSSSEVVGHLALHEKVTRSRVEQGYAHVIATPSGVEGWVDNAQLIWRLPPDPVPAAEVPAVETPAVAPPPDPAPALAPVSAPTDATPEPPAEAPDPPAETPATPTPAVYDPF